MGMIMTGLGTSCSLTLRRVMPLHSSKTGDGCRRHRYLACGNTAGLRIALTLISLLKMMTLTRNCVIDPNTRAWRRFYCQK